MHVDDIALSLIRAGINLNARVKVRVVDAVGSPVAGATVSGQWSGLTSDADAGVTDLDGSVTLNSDRLKNVSSGGIFSFTITTILKNGGAYDPSANVETSDSITVS